MAIIWTPNISTGVDWQDAQHRELFNQINSFIDALGRGAGKDELMTLFGFLDRYVKTHFSKEEGAMMSTKFAGSAQHLAQHQKFTGNMNDLKSRISSGGDSRQLCNEARKQLADWFYEHVSKNDKTLGSHISANQLHA